MRSEEVIIVLGEMQNKVSTTIEELTQYGVSNNMSVKETLIVPSTFFGDDISKALLKFNPVLADMYIQSQLDLKNNTRISWAGTAHTIREVLVGILRELAPDSDVMKQPGFKLEKDQSKPTHTQRAMYILKQRNASSNEQAVVRYAEEMDDWIASLVRASYSRASDAAHRRYQDKNEVQRIMKYFEAFARDLLDIRDEI